MFVLPKVFPSPNMLIMPLGSHWSVVHSFLLSYCPIPFFRCPTAQKRCIFFRVLSVSFFFIVMDVFSSKVTRYETFLLLMPSLVVSACLLLYHPLPCYMHVNSFCIFFFFIHYGKKERRSGKQWMDQYKTLCKCSDGFGVPPTLESSVEHNQVWTSLFLN